MAKRVENKSEKSKPLGSFYLNLKIPFSLSMTNQQAFEINNIEECKKMKSVYNQALANICGFKDEKELVTSLNPYVRMIKQKLYEKSNCLGNNFSKKIVEEVYKIEKIGENK